MTNSVRPQILVLMILAFVLPALCHAQVVIGIVEDGDLPRPIVPLSLLESEFKALAGDEFAFQMPADKRLNGGWTRDGVRRAIRTLLDDPEVDIVIATGLISSNEAAKFENLPKPVIASIVADVELQDIPAVPLADKIVSGKHNLVYLARVRFTDENGNRIEQTNINEAIDIFHDAVDFRHVAVLIDELTIESIPRLTSEKARETSTRLGVRTSIVPYAGSIAATLANIPAQVDAVLVGPLLRLEHEQMRELAQGLIDRRLPSFALLGRSELMDGLLMTSGGREEDAVRYARRLALNVQRIVLGDDPATIDVRIAEPQRLAINMRTARAIGFFPRYAVLLDAEQLYVDEVEAGEPLGLNEAMAEALQANLALNVAAMEPMIASAETRLARSQLFPQLGVGARATQIDEDRANPLLQSERSIDARVSGSQVIYSDDVVAGWTVARYLKDASNLGYRSQVLDTLQAAASGYLAVLRATALEKVQRSNLEVTRTNLELARLRQSIGASGRGDVLRWESQLATDRQNLVSAEAERRVALTAFNQVLNRPQNMNFAPRDEDVARSIALFEDERFRVFVDNAAVWRLFQDFSVQLSLEQSPELAQLDQLIAAQQRQVLASRRKYYVPELSLDGTWGKNLDQGGAGSGLSLAGLDDTAWSVGVSASWPLFSGGALRAQLDRNRFGLRQLERQRAALALQLETRTRVALHRASGTYPSLEFSMEAAQAGSDNLELVTDAYRRGAVSVTELVDAQNAALAAELRAVDARYAYMVDVVEILRATGDFALLVDPGSTEAWFQKVEAYMRERGITAPR